ncbi:hypothetical protein [Rhodococcus sp. IEGM 1307]|uniref:hypothetical protein n=1 Tax=Rhodococcus sp. IEGM 1307 TaxID=3047091 RepID=UPI0024B7DC42|nr:hypothetical protein [Rhodococcus sp. IEGM 1307]MDI9979806.1 hypothetical protein [Rhodococcus sp. IEGM 1307]
MHPHTPKRHARAAGVLTALTGTLLLGAGPSSAAEPVLAPTITVDADGLVVRATVTNPNPGPLTYPGVECFPQLTDHQNTGGDMPWMWPTLPQARVPGFGASIGETKQFLITVPHPGDYTVEAYCWLQGDVQSAAGSDKVTLTVDGRTKPQPEPEPTRPGLPFFGS